MIKMNSVHRNGLSVILFENLTDKFGFVIGKADKRYTLWKYTRSSNEINIEYVQVLSDRLSRVTQRFPEVFICEELRGEHKMTINRNGLCKSSSKPANAPKSITDFLSMPFGECKGIAFKELTPQRLANLINNIKDFKWTDAWGEEFDFRELIENKNIEAGNKKLGNKWFTESYLNSPKAICWQVNYGEDEETKKAFTEYAKSLGYSFLMGRCYPSITGGDEKSWMIVARQIIPKIEYGLPFSFVAPANKNSFWFGLPIEFLSEDKTDIYTYYGESHFLKVTNKKGEKVNKRVKGKTIEVLEYEVLEDNDNKPWVLVKKFNLI